MHRKYYHESHLCVLLGLGLGATCVHSLTQALALDFIWIESDEIILLKGGGALWSTHAGGN